jgi:hypothetical protein
MKLRFLLIAVSAMVLALGQDAEAARRHRPAKPKPVAVPVVTVAPAPFAKEGSLRSAWVQYGPGGTLEARAVVDGDACPTIFLDLKETIMQPRAAADAGFLTACRADIPAGARQAALAFRRYNAPPPETGAGVAALKEWIEKETGVPVPGPRANADVWQWWLDRMAEQIKYDIVPLPLPVPAPQRIVVVGDGGCRIKGTVVQDCRDPELWPFARIAAEAAKLRPDLVIHVGDYISRETVCPANVDSCQGMPTGDNWPTWDADFFMPAKPLLAAAPWVVARGNHEDCKREGAGWLRLLGPAPYVPGAPCLAHVPSYSVRLGNLNLVVMDNSDAPETSVVADAIPVYRREIAALADEPAPAWLVMHRPIWGAVKGPLGMPIGGNLNLMAAAPEGIPSPVELMLSGHIHTFEAINYSQDDHVPPQIVAGIGGDLLDPAPSKLRGTIFQGDSNVRVADGVSIGSFGFLLMTRNGKVWTIDVYDAQGRIERTCLFRAGRVDCPVRR